MTSPIRAVAAGLLAGAVAGLTGFETPAGIAAVAVLGAAGAFAARRDPRRAWTIAASAAAALAGLLRGGDVASGPPPVEPQALACVVGTVTRAADIDVAPPAADAPDEREANFRVQIGSQRAELDVRVRLREGDVLPPLLPGDRVRLVGSAAPVRRPTNPGTPDRRTDLLRQGVCGQFDVGCGGAATDAGTADDGPVTRVRRGGEIARRALLGRLRDACGGPGPAPALLGCLLLGDRSDLDDATATAFRDSGTAHLLSVSGLHVVLLAAAARAFARRTVPRRLRRRFGLPTLVTLLVIYCALCRFSTPVVRAAVYLAVAEAARACGRRPSPLDTLAAAAALVVGVDAAQVLDASFQLSFAAVAGLSLYTRGLRAALFPSIALHRKFPGQISPRRLRLLERLAVALSTSLAASAATAPIVAEVFGRLQPGAPLSNLVAVPLAAFLVPLAAVLALVGGSLSWLTAPLAKAAVAPLRASVGVAAAVPGATIEIGHPHAALVAASVALLVAAAWAIVRRPRVGAALLAAAWLVVAATPICRTNDREPEIVVLDVGHGLCVLARSGDGGDVLFDAGGHVPGIGRRTIVPALRELGVRRLGAVFISHQGLSQFTATYRRAPERDGASRRASTQRQGQERASQANGGDDARTGAPVPSLPPPSLGALRCACRRRGAAWPVLGRAPVLARLARSAVDDARSSPLRYGCGAEVGPDPSVKRLIALHIPPFPFTQRDAAPSAST
jgi:competence protein ComEC